MLPVVGESDRGSMEQLMHICKMVEVTRGCVAFTLYGIHIAEKSVNMFMGTTRQLHARLEVNDDEAVSDVRGQVERATQDLA